MEYKKNMYGLINEKCKDNPERKDVVLEDFKEWIKGKRALPNTKELREILDETK